MRRQRGPRIDRRVIDANLNMVLANFEIGTDRKPIRRMPQRPGAMAIDKDNAASRTGGLYQACIPGPVRVTSGFGSGLPAGRAVSSDASLDWLGKWRPPSTSKYACPAGRLFTMKSR